MLKPPDILPQPFEWIHIPAGDATISHNPPDHKRAKIHLDSFYIAKYPITNEQFQLPASTCH